MTIDALRDRLFAVSSWLDAAPVLLVAVTAGLAAWATALGLARIGLRAGDQVARRTSTPLDDDLLARIRRPALLLGPVVGVHAFAAVLGLPWATTAASLIETLVLTYVAVTAFEILVVEAWIERRQGLTVPGPVRQLVIGVAYGAVLLGVGSDLLGFDLTPLVATGSVTSLILGLALQQPLSNLFAGIVLHAERHPRVGDWLLIDGREGEVTDIGWRSTRLRTLSDDVLVVPNLALLNAQVINFTTPTPVCGRPVPVPIPFDVPPHVVDRWAREVLETIEGVVGAWEPRTKVWLASIDDHCQRYVVRFWVTEFRIHDDCESELLKRLWYKLAEQGVQFPAPYRAIRVLTDPPSAMAAVDAPRPTPFPPELPRPTGTGEPSPRAR
ncbi:MAG: mechanosensitive ion channel family protein [Myxococcota bacterium]